MKKHFLNTCQTDRLRVLIHEACTQQGELWIAAPTTETVEYLEHVKQVLRQQRVQILQVPNGNLEGNGGSRFMEIKIHYEGPLRTVISAIKQAGLVTDDKSLEDRNVDLWGSVVLENKPWDDFANKGADWRSKISTKSGRLSYGDAKKSYGPN